MARLLAGEALPGHKQDLTKGHYFSRKELDALKDISGLSSSKEVDERIHALWLPPNHGACITIDGKRYSLVDDVLLKELGRLYGS